MPIMQYTIDLPTRRQQLDANLKRWDEIQRDPWYARLGGRIETNAFGSTIVNPPASGEHSDRQGDFVFLLRSMLGSKAIPECPISTINGVKVADVGWFSKERYKQVRGQKVFEVAPEICVEIVSLSNSLAELMEKKTLYFDAGANEVWICNRDGRIDFFIASQPNEIREASIRLPNFSMPI